MNLLLSRGLFWGIYKFDNFKTVKKSSITLNIAYEKSSLNKINYGLTQGKIIHKIANIANSQQIMQHHHYT